MKLPDIRRMLLIDVVLACCVFLAVVPARATTWYVKADATRLGDGSRRHPFATLREVESASDRGDTIYVLQSLAPLDGGIQLKDRQQLIGLGPNVTKADPASARALITNTSGAHYDGDAIRLAKHNLVQNIQIDNAYRSSILGINAVGAQIRDNLLTNDMAVHDIFAIEGPAPSTCGGTPPVCVGEWPNGYILFAPQTNHFGAITLVTCGPGSRSPFTNPDVRSQGYCKFLDPTLGAAASTVPSTGRVVIDDNIIRDSNSDGIMVIDDLGVLGNFSVTNNVVKDLSQRLPDPSAVGITDHVVRSRGFCIITIETSVSNLLMDNYTGSNLSPFGNFAADGIVFLTAGGPSVVTDPGPMNNAKLSDLAINNPLLTGDTSNGDSIEIQHRGSTNGVNNIDITRAHLQDPASTNIKLIESSNPDNGTYNVTVSDSELSNINTHGTEDSQSRDSGTERNATKAINLTLKHVKISGLGRAIGLQFGPTVNTNSINTLRISVEDSSLSDLTEEVFQWSQAVNKPIGTDGGAIIDFGGGPLGSRGHNRFVNDGVAGYVPPGADPTGIDPVTVNGDFSVANANPAPSPAIRVYASEDYWGGGPPISSTTPGGTTNVYIPAGSNATFTSNSFLTRDPGFRLYPEHHERGRDSDRDDDHGSDDHDH
jgi:hypothetical protein